MSLKGPETAFLISYPADGTKLNSALGGGQYLLDFDSGIVTDPSGKTSNMSSNLRKVEKQFIKSIFIFCSSSDAVIKLGNFALAQRQNVAWLVQGIYFKTMTISFPSNRTPNNAFGLQIVASTDDLFPLNITNLIQAFALANITGNVTNALTVLFDILAAGFAQLSIVTQNIDAANQLILHIQYSEDGVNWVDYQGYPVTLAAGQNDNFNSSIQHAYFRVYAESNVVGGTAYRIQSSIGR